MFDLVPPYSKNKLQWNFDESSSSLVSTSDLLDRIGRQVVRNIGNNTKDNSSKSLLMLSPALQAISNNNRNRKQTLITQRSKPNT